MKKIIFLMFIVALVSNSCLLKRGEDKEPTQKGKKIFDSWMLCSNQMVEKGVRTAFKFNTWLKADSAGRIEAENCWFPYMRIRPQGNGVYHLYDGANLAYVIETGEIPLEDEHSSWAITLCTSATQVTDLAGDGKIQLSYAGNNVWHISSDTSWTLNSLQPDMFLSLPNGIRTDINKGDYELWGTGKYLFFSDMYDDSRIILDFQIVENIKQTMFLGGSRDRRNWTAGVFKMTAHQGADSFEVEAHFLDNNQVQIFYGNHNHVYNVN